jgi:hypothetical protein
MNRLRRAWVETHVWSARERSWARSRHGQAGHAHLTILAAENDHTDDMHSAKKISFDYAPIHPMPGISGENKDAPSIRIVSAAPGSTVHNGFAVAVVPKNFEFSCALYGKPDVPGYATGTETWIRPRRG